VERKGRQSTTALVGRSIPQPTSQPASLSASQPASQNSTTRHVDACQSRFLCLHTIKHPAAVAAVAAVAPAAFIPYWNFPPARWIVPRQRRCQEALKVRLDTRYLLLCFDELLCF
jgi:hypothetical protein